MAGWCSVDEATAGSCSRKRGGLRRLEPEAEHTSSTSGNHGEITVNAVHLTGPEIDVVLASSSAGIDCAE